LSEQKVVDLTTKIAELQAQVAATAEVERVLEAERVAAMAERDRTLEAEKAKAWDSRRTHSDIHISDNKLTIKRELNTAPWVVATINCPLTGSDSSSGCSNQEIH
jgi:hypothetical protein